MNPDLTALLQSWSYDAENPSNNFRRISASDGRPLLQVREPLGIQQLEYLGRPDGVRPNGKSTWLEYYEEQADNDPFFSLSHEDCLRLMQEGILFYQRYLVLYQMEDWEGVARDTGRNIRYFDFAKLHAEHQEDSLTIEQYRPYIIRMNSIARSQLLSRRGRLEDAATLLREALETISNLEPVDSAIFKMEMEKSVKHLTDMIGDFESSRPESQIDKLRREQKNAILREDFELAARLRDEIRSLEGEYAGNN